MLGMKVILPAFAAFTLIPAVFESASAASDPTGIWMDDTGRGAVEIKQCGNNLCGNVVWVKSASDASGCGKPVIGDVKPVGGGRWDNGWIYSPEKARKYDVELTPLANGNLKVLGYAGMKFLSKTMIWKRAPQDLKLCGQTEAKAVKPVDKRSEAETASITPPAAPVGPPGKAKIRKDGTAVAPADAPPQIQTAIAVAKQQGARSWGLRAALALAKLYQSTGRPADAHAVLARALEGFSPTPEMPEIAEAISLIERLT